MKRRKTQENTKPSNQPTNERTNERNTAISSIKPKTTNPTSPQDSTHSEASRITEIEVWACQPTMEWIQSSYSLGGCCSVSATAIAPINETTANETTANETKSHKLKSERANVRTCERAQPYRKVNLGRLNAGTDPVISSEGSELNEP